jgi:hypothetical protein
MKIMSMGALATAECTSIEKTVPNVGAPMAPSLIKPGEILRKRLAEFGFLKRWRLRACSWMIVFVAKYGKELLIEYMMERASEISVKTTMVILDRERIAHCYLCPSRFQLRKVGNRYACLQHSQEVMAKVA